MTKPIFFIAAKASLFQLAFSFAPSQRGHHSVISVYQASLVDNTNGREGPIMDTPLRSSGDDGLLGLFEASKKASIPCGADVRFEWGRWVDDQSMEELMERMNELILTPGVYETLVPGKCDSSTGSMDDGSLPSPRRLRIAGGDFWDCILHVLPQGTEWNGRWPTGAWAVVRALTGVAEVSMLRGPNRDGFYTKATKKALRGGGDGTLSGGSVGSGEDCVKYVGGALRSYSGRSGKTTLLEVVVRPPVGKQLLDGDGLNSSTIETLMSPESFLEIAPQPVEEEPEEDITTENVATDDSPKHLGTKMGMSFEKVGGLDDQLNAIVRRVLASRANPEAAKRLGVSHVRGILLSGPPGCGKTLLARELSQMLGAREPQIVNGPEILDKFVGEAEKNIRALFTPAEIEYAQVGDKSALHVIILDEMDAIARKRGSVGGDSTGVRDSVVNQLLAKMDGVKEANNILVVGLTNRPELLDPALLRPGRLEVQLRVELPDLLGRRDILRIHTRRMKEAGGLSTEALTLLESSVEDGFPARTEYFTGAELAGLVRSAASFALARTVEDEDLENAGIISVIDLEIALREVRPALGKQDEVLEMRYPHGISAFSPSMERVMRDLLRFVAAPYLDRTEGKVAPKLESLLLVGSTSNGGAGATALACWAAAKASGTGDASYVRLITSLDLLGSGVGGDEASRAAALAEKFSEAREMPNSLLVLDDVDQLVSGSGLGGYSSVMLATLRALLRSPPVSANTAKAGGHSVEKKTIEGKKRTKTLKIIAATSRKDAACVILHELFDESLVVPQISDKESARKLVADCGKVSGVTNADVMADIIIDRLGSVGCKTVLRLVDRSVAAAGIDKDANSDTSLEELQTSALATILDDMVSDDALAYRICEVL